MRPGVTADEIQSLTREVKQAFSSQANQETLIGVNVAIDTLDGGLDELSVWMAVASSGVLHIAERDSAGLAGLLERVEDARNAIELDRMAAQAINAVQTLSAAVRAVNDQLNQVVTSSIEGRSLRLRETLAATSRLSEDDLPAHRSAMEHLESLVTVLPEVDPDDLEQAIGEADSALARASRLWENLPTALQELYQSITADGRIRFSEIPEATLLALQDSPLAAALDLGLIGTQQEDIG